MSPSRLAFCLVSSLLVGCQCVDPRQLEFTACASQQDCAAGETCCPDLRCRADCTDVTDAGGCPACTAEQVCAGDACVPRDCGATRCAEGAACRDGRCVQLSCFGVLCPGSEDCFDGHCYPKACGGLPCDGGLCIGAQCEDRSCQGLQCPSGSRCSGGACVGCAAAETRCNDGVDDDCNGLADCADPACADQDCTDHDQCTVGEKCSAGVCTGGSAAQCVSPPTCRSGPGVCDTDAGACVYPPATDGSPCSVSDVCMMSAICSAGACTSMPRRCDAPAGSCLLSPGTCLVDGGCGFTFKDAGAACDDGNACTTSSTCNAGGACVGAGSITCAAPAKCKQPGVCNPASGTCTYANSPNTTACDDGNVCTGPDQCNGSGSCGGAARADGFLCGSQYANRCCGGSCVDISSDEKHCGGCNTGCASGRTCQSVAVTSNCSSAPSNTSGRCTCAGATSECPRGQICRAGQPQYNNVCTPDDDSDCQGGARSPALVQCPEYCKYP